MWIRWILLKRQRERDGGGDGSELEAVVESYLGSAIQSPPRSAPSFCACIFVCAASRTIRRRNLSPPQPPPHPPPPPGGDHARRANLAGGGSRVNWIPVGPRGAGQEFHHRGGVTWMVRRVCLRTRRRALADAVARPAGPPIFSLAWLGWGDIVRELLCGRPKKSVCSSTLV